MAPENTTSEKAISVTDLRRLTASDLRSNKETMIVCFGGAALAALVPYHQYVALQELYLEAMKIVGEIGR